MKALLLLLLPIAAVLCNSRMVHAAASSGDNDVVEFKAVYDEGASGRQDFDYPRLAKTAKSSWPELVGKPYEESKAVIQAEAPDVRVFKVSASGAVTTDFSLQRVRVFVSDDGRDIVQLTPTRG